MRVNTAFNRMLALPGAWVESVAFTQPGAPARPGVGGAGGARRARPGAVGVRRRLFTGAVPRAVEVRDRECFHAFCDRRPEDCEIDHVQPYSAGGPTVEDNGRAACGYHNRLRHRRS